MLTKFEGPHPDVQGETVAVGYTRYGQRKVAITADVNEEAQFEMIANRKHLGFLAAGQSGVYVWKPFFLPLAPRLTTVAKLG